MRGKNYNTGLRGVLFEARHYQRMGAALWLYGWLVLRQTHQQGMVGWVLGGAPISYREIEEETGFNLRTLERWMQTLRRHGYIETQAAPAGMIVRITKAKKIPQAARRVAEGVRKVAEGNPQSCVASDHQFLPNKQLAARIGSSFVDRSFGRVKQASSSCFHNQNQNFGNETQNCTPKPSGLGREQNHGANKYPYRSSNQVPDPEPNLTPRDFLPAVHLQQQLLRAEREEAVRRELAVGTGPEVQRS